MSGPLAGIRIIELAGIGPAPFCGMMLADMGAEVIRVERPGEGDPLTRGPHKVLFRNRRSVAIDLKTTAGVAAVLRMCVNAEALFEGFRPGVAERLGVGPEACMSRNPRLVYGRMTGWGQTGPLAMAAGHDINYISLSGALNGIGRAFEKPVPPLNLVGDNGGGGLMLAFGIACALIEATRSGKGQVVDASIVEGSAALMATMFAMRHTGEWTAARGTNMLDSGVPYYDTYETRDGKYVSIAAIEPRFFALLCRILELPLPLFSEQNESLHWPEQRRYLADLFRTRTRDAWCSLLEGSDACFSPVLDIGELTQHPHIRARTSIIESGGIPQAAPTPRFSRTSVNDGVPLPAAEPGMHTVETLRALGFESHEIEDLLATGAAFQAPPTQT